MSFLAKRGCWIEGCETVGLTGEELVNDEEFRAAVEYFKENGEITVEQARKIVHKKSMVIILS